MPEKELWKAVFMQAVNDLFSIHRHERVDAQDWLFSPGQAKDRKRALELAGIDFESWTREMKIAAQGIAKRNCEE